MIYYHYSERVKDPKNTAAMFSTRKEFYSGTWRGSSSVERTPDKGEVVGLIPTLGTSLLHGGSLLLALSVLERVRSLFTINRPFDEIASKWYSHSINDYLFGGVFCCLAVFRRRTD